MPAINQRNRRPIRRGPGFFDTLHRVQQAGRAVRAGAGIAQRFLGRPKAGMGNLKAQNRGQADRHSPFPSMRDTLVAARQNAKSPFERAALATREGVNPELIGSGRQLQNRVFASQQLEIDKALKELGRLSKRHEGQSPHTDRLRRMKNEILRMMLVEGKINSFEDMRDALIEMANQTGGKLGIRSKREFEELFSKKDMFNGRELELLQKIFQKKLSVFMVEWH